MDYNWNVEEALKKDLKRFEDGVFTRHELVERVLYNALHPQFFSHLHLIPPEILEEVKEKAKNCPAHPEDWLCLHNPRFYGPDLDLDDIQRDRESREWSYWQRRRIHELFHPDQPLPEFVPIILAGVVKDVVKIDGVVVIFGADSLQMRRHPIHLVRPDGSRTITHVVDQDYVKRECDNDSPDNYHRKFGQQGLFLADNVRSIDDVPIGTEVWIDRTNAPPIPPRPEGW